MTAHTRIQDWHIAKRLAIIWRNRKWRVARKRREKQQANALGNVVERYRAAPRAAANSSNNFVPIT